MGVDLEKLGRAVELVAAAAWGVEAASHALARGNADGARNVLAECRPPLAEGLGLLRGVLDGAVRDRGHAPPDVLSALEELRRVAAAVEEADPA